MTEIICETNGEWTIETEYILRNDTETKKRLVKCKVLDDNNKWINPKKSGQSLVASLQIRPR